LFCAKRGRWYSFLVTTILAGIRNHAATVNEGRMSEEDKSSSIRAPRAVKRKLREAAVNKVRQDIIHAGRQESEYSTEELEFLVAEKEKEIWSGIGWKGFGIVALLLGINIGI
jgi:hypothetical protein